MALQTPHASAKYALPVIDHTPQCHLDKQQQIDQGKVAIPCS